MANDDKTSKVDLERLAYKPSPGIVEKNAHAPIIPTTAAMPVVKAPASGSFV